MEHLSRRELFAAAASAALATAVRHAAVGDPAVGDPAAGAAGAGSLRPGSDPATGRGPRRRSPKKAVKYGMVAVGAGVTAKFELLRDCGFDGVELDSPSDLVRDDVLAAARATGLQIPGVVDSVHWNKPLSSADPAVRQAGLDALQQALRDAAAYGASSVLLVPAVVRKDVFYGDAWQRSQAEIQKVLPLCEQLQVDLLIENVWNGFLLGPTELQRYVDELQSERVGVHFDAGNLVRFGFPEQWVPILGKRIRKVDVKDFDRKRNSFDVKLNDGDTDWPAIVRELRAVGYDGWFTAEMQGGDGDYLKDLARRMDAFLHA